LQKEVARLVFSRALDVRPLITHRFPLEKTPDAIALASSPTEESLKIVVEPNIEHRTSNFERRIKADIQTEAFSPI
jgi:hypothetical protein